MRATEIRAWVFRLLVAAVAGFIVFSFISPWWNLDVYEEASSVIAVKDAFTIYGYGSHTNLVQYRNMAVPFLTPRYQVILAFVFLGASILLMLYSTWLKGRKGQLLLGIIGLIYILYPLGAYLLLRRGVSRFGYLLQGTVPIQGATVTTYFMPIYFAVYGAALALILLALLRVLIAPSLKEAKSKGLGQTPNAGQ